MFRFMAVVSFVFVLAMPAQAQQVFGFVEFWNTVTESKTTPEINIYVVGPIKGKVGWTTWTLMTEEWSEALVGLTLSPKEWVSFSASLGIETDDSPLRHGASARLGKGRWSALTIYENGGSGYWYRVLGTFQATKSVSVGLNSQRFIGTGPYVSKSFGKLSLWGVYAVDNNKGIVSARFSF